MKLERIAPMLVAALVFAALGLAIGPWMAGLLDFYAEPVWVNGHSRTGQGFAGVGIVALALIWVGVPVWSYAVVRNGAGREKP